MRLPSTAEIAAARTTLVRAVQAAGALQLKGASSPRVEPKGEGDLVTDVDRACEVEVVGLIRNAHPTHAVLAEEGTGARVKLGPLWILDPLDGTKNYLHGLPRFSCALALMWDEVAVLGAVYNPALDELFVAEHGRGATLNGASLRVSTTADLPAALVGSALTVRRRFAARHFARLQRLVVSSQGVRVGGCASLDLCDVARGRLDAYLEEGLDPWDTAAGALIVREAGGVVTDFGGEPHDPFRAETLAANGLLGAALVEALRLPVGPQ
jgi:myo-inositol-1(or 4)-monophosphatase